jgi:hypothetical protein
VEVRGFGKLESIVDEGNNFVFDLFFDLEPVE